MSTILERLAALRQRREILEARTRPASSSNVNTALAAAFAAAGSPTCGSWDADYIQRLRNRGRPLRATQTRPGPDETENSREIPANPAIGASSDIARLESDSESDNEIVVLPPPARKLDPIARRAAWRREMLLQAREAKRRALDLTDDMSEDDPNLKTETVLEQLTEEVLDEEMLEAESKENVSHEQTISNGDIDADEKGDTGQRELRHSDSGNGQGPSSSPVARMGISDKRSAQKEAMKDGDKEAAHSNKSINPEVLLSGPHCGKESVSEVPASGCATGDARNEASESEPGIDILGIPQPVQNDEHDDVDLAKTSSFEKGNSLRRISRNLTGCFLDDEAEDDSDSFRIPDQLDSNSEDDGLGEAGDDLRGFINGEIESKTESVATHHDSETAAAMFHRAWQQKKDERDVIALAMGPTNENSNGLNSRHDHGDTASTLEENSTLARQRGLLEGASKEVALSNKTGMDDTTCEITAVGDVEEPGCGVDDYLEKMFRLNAEEPGCWELEETGKGSNAHPNSTSGDCSPEGKRERRKKAIALWKARQRRHQSGCQERAEFSLTGLLGCEKNSRRREALRAQLEGASRLTLDCEPFGESRGVDSLPGEHLERTARLSTNSIRLGRNLASVNDSRSSEFRTPSKRLGAVVRDVQALPEWERRRICLERKRERRRPGSSIGAWAFASESTAPRHCIEPGQNQRVRNGPVSNSRTAYISLGATSTVRKKRNCEVPVVSGGDNIEGSLSSAPKKAKRSVKGLLDLLGSRPQTYGS